MSTLPSYRNQSIDLQSKSINCFVYDGDFGNEIIKKTCRHSFQRYDKFTTKSFSMYSHPKPISIFQLKNYENYPLINLKNAMLLRDN